MSMLLKRGLQAVTILLVSVHHDHDPIALAYPGGIASQPLGELPQQVLLAAKWVQTVCEVGN
jgi:hypothetical protein